ncbi:hypothetical protein C5167_021587, partial [Papaver somniferum]
KRKAPLAAAKLALVKETYDKDPSAQKCLGTDVVTQLDAERQKNNNAVHGQIGDSSYQQGIGIPSSYPSSFGLCCLRNFRKKVVALAYVDTKLLIDDHYDCMIEEVIDPTAMLCDRDDDVVLGNVKGSEFVKWPKAYVTTVGEPSS